MGDPGGLAVPLAAYQPLRDAVAAQSAGGGIKIGDPKASSRAILALVDAPNPPLRLLLGSFAVMLAPMVYQQRLKTWKEWEDFIDMCRAVAQQRRRRGVGPHHAAFLERIATLDRESRTLKEPWKF